MSEQNVTANTGIVEIALDRLQVHPKNIRESYEGISELAASIKANGIMQNLTVVPDPVDKGMYFVVIGNRRLTAAKEAGIATAPCRITSMEEADQVMSMLAENMNRRDLKIHEEAAGVQMCLTDFGCSVEDVSEKTGMSQSTVRHRANIAKLDKKVLREKSLDVDFQLSITDLAKLEKVSSIATRNKILREARDSRDLAWKAQAASDEEKRKKVLKKLVALAEKQGIKEAPNNAVSEIYSNKWTVICEYDLTGNVPKKLVEGSTDGLYYVIVYRMFKVIRKAKKVKRVLSDHEIKEKETARKRRQIKAMYKEMYAQMGDFVGSIIDGSTADLKDKDELTTALWNVLVSRTAVLSIGSMAAVMLGKEPYSVTAEERSKAVEKIHTLPLHIQMLSAAYCAFKDVKLCSRDGSYYENCASPLKEFYSCLVLYGFSFDKEEYRQVMDGTHELYAVRKDVKATSTVNAAVNKKTD